MASVIDEWVNRSGLAIDMMAHFDLGAARIDYSTGSLQAVADVVDAAFTEPAEILDTARQPQVESVVAYTGECLLRAARGHWTWDDAPGFAERGAPAPADADLAARLNVHRWRFDGAAASGIPVVHADPALQLAPVSPLHLLMAQVRRRGSGEPGPLVTALQRWRTAVDDHRAAHPEWDVVTEPVLTDGMPIMPASDVLDDWLRARQRAFPAWAGTHGGIWDHTPDTLDDLAALVFRTTPGVASFEDPANADFAEGAAWYFGETLRRAYPARWMYRGYLREPGDPLAVCFTVQTNDNRDFTGPFVRISNALKRRDPTWVRRGYDQWAANA